MYNLKLYFYAIINATTNIFNEKHFKYIRVFGAKDFEINSK